MSKRNAQPLTSGFVIVAVVVSACASAFGTGVFHSLPVYASQYSTAVLADSPSDYWPADDGVGSTVAESSAVGSRNLTFTNPPTWYGSGLVSGSGSAVQGASCGTCLSAWPSGVPAALPASRSEEIWFLSPTGGAPFPQGLISVRQPENGSGGCSEGHTDVLMEPNPNIRVDSLDCFVGEFATICNFGQNGIPNVLDKAPHLIDVTENSGVVSIYVDATLCATGSGANTALSSPDCVAVGAAQCGSGNGTFPITQDSVVGQAALYPAPLTQTQVANHFAAAGAAGGTPSAPQSVVATPLTTSLQGPITTVSVSWTTPISSGSSPITSYTMDALQGGSVVASLTVPAPANSGSLDVPSTCSRSTTVTVFATSAAGQGAPGSSPAFVDVQVPSSPTVVVILMPGEGGSGPADNSFDPSSVANYCNLKNAGEPAVHKIANLSFDNPGNPNPNFTDAIAALGAIILPFSYTGSHFAGPTSASFRVTAYSATDAGKASPMGARALDKEITTAHGVYPNARVYIAGDSVAGAVETEWYAGEPSRGDRGFYSSVKYPYVGGIFTMDGPINGIRIATLCLVIGCPSGVFNGASPQQLQELGRRWNNSDLNDQAYESKDVYPQAVFSPMGTQGDLVYDSLDPGYDGIHTQYMCAHGSATHGLCGPESLDFLTPEPPGPPWLTPSDPTSTHDWLFSQFPVINYVSSWIQVGGPSITAAPVIAGSSVTTSAASQIQASLSTNVAAPGQTVTITSSGGFGSATGQVLFAGASNQIVAGTISSWSDTSIVVVVPSTAITGPVVGRTSAGMPFYAGGLAVEGAANRVAHLSYQAVAAALSGQSETLTVTATDASGVGVTNALISLTDGLGTLTCTSNSSGVCGMSVPGYQSTIFMLISGTTAIQVPFTWNQPPVQALTLAASPMVLLNGASTTLTATVTDSSGNPVANEPVNFDANGSAALTLSSLQGRTNSAGVVAITASSATSGVAQIEAITDDNTAVDAVQVSWANTTVNAISPTTGPSAGGTSVIISGTGFSSGATVYFGTNPASSVTFVNSTKLGAVSPAGSGAVDVRVGVGGTYSNPVPGDLFTYVPPSVTGVSPNSGPTGGGTKVTISGTNFAPGAQVKFGGFVSGNVVVLSTTSITAVSPPETPGIVDITVTTVGVTSSSGPADHFTFTGAALPPTITQLSPNSGGNSGGTIVTVTGANFAIGSTVSVGSNAGTNVTVQSITMLTFATPAGASGTVDVRVTTPAGTSATVTADQFTYGPSPTVSSVKPSSGPRRGGTTVNITGTNFSTTTAVYFGRNLATNVEIESDKSVTATSPSCGMATSGISSGSSGAIAGSLYTISGPFVVDVVVTTKYGSSSTNNRDKFTYVSGALSCS